MEGKELKKKVFSGLMWTFGERILSQGISFVLSIVLARMLMPSEYGMIALVLVFINLTSVFVTGGIGESLIQKKDPDETDYSTLFYCSITISLLLYAALFILAPYISYYYENPELKWVLRVLAISLPIASVSTIQQAYVSKRMLFKKFFLATLCGTILSGVVGILMAYSGYGVWALAVQYVTNIFINTIVLFLIVKWRPKLLFSMSSAKELIGFGWRLTGANFINVGYNELRGLVIGKRYSMMDLAFYNRGNQFPGLLIANIDVAIGKVMFPAMTQVNQDSNRLKMVARRSMKTTSYIIFPLMIGLICAAQPLIELLLTSKWLPAVPFLQICCIYWLFQPLQTANWQTIKALGRGDLLVKMEIYKKVIGVLLLLLTMNISVYAIAMSNAIFACISMIINMLPNKKLMNYSMTEQLKDVLPSLLISILMGGIVYMLSLLNMPAYEILLLQIICGGIVYVGASFIFKLDTFMFLFSQLKQLIKSILRSGKVLEG